MAQVILAKTEVPRHNPSPTPDHRIKSVCATKMPVMTKSSAAAHRPDRQLSAKGLKPKIWLPEIKRKLQAKALRNHS
jgi:hypothetical protein